jgi:DNA-directed RNA polymerase specialized sigma subunit
MSDIVIELKKRNWSDTRIAKELGMDADEVLRLCQVSGLAEVFGDEEFSKAWDAGLWTDEEIDLLNEEDL